MSADDKPKIDARALSLTQLQHLVARGSQRARAELNRRMAQADALGHAAPLLAGRARMPEPDSDRPPSADAPRANLAARSPPRMASPADPPASAARPASAKPELVTAASLDEMLDGMAALASASFASASAPGMAFPGNHDAPASAAPQDAQILRLQALARQDEARQRAQGPPALIGMTLMVWGALILLGGLALLSRTGGLYYVLFGLACGGVGWLLFRCKQAAIWAHAACALASVLWAWRGYAGNTIFTALVQSAPIWISALWIAVPPVREPLG